MKVSRPGREKLALVTGERWTRGAVCVVCKPQCKSFTKLPGYHRSSLVHSLILHCLKIRLGSQCSTVPTARNAATLKRLSWGQQTGLLQQWLFSADLCARPQGRI